MNFSADMNHSNDLMSFINMHIPFRIKELKNATDTFLVELLHCFSSRDKTGSDMNISADMVHSNEMMYM